MAHMAAHRSGTGTTKHFVCTVCRMDCHDSYKYQYTIQHACKNCARVTRFQQAKSVAHCPNPKCAAKVYAYAAQGGRASPHTWARHQRQGSGGYWSTM